MIDIKFLRANPDVVKENIKKKFQDSKIELVDKVIELDEQYRKTKVECDNLRNQRKVKSKEIGGFMAKGMKDEAEAAKAEILGWVKDLAPDLFIAGPAFNAGRYGVACGTIAAAVQKGNTELLDYINDEIKSLADEQFFHADLCQNHIGKVWGAGI